MTLCNILWTNPWLLSVGSMCYVIYFRGYENRAQSRDSQGCLFCLGWSQTWRAHWLWLTLPRFSSQADVGCTSFGSEGSFSLLLSMCSSSFLHPVYQSLPAQASIHGKTMHVGGWKQKRPSPGKYVIFFNLDYCYFGFGMSPQAARPASLAAPSQLVSGRKHPGASFLAPFCQRKCVCRQGSGCSAETWQWSCAQQRQRWSMMECPQPLWAYILCWET